MRIPIRLCECLGLIALLSVAGRAQSDTPSAQAPADGASVSGTVTVDGKPAAGIPVVLMTTDPKRERGSIFDSSMGFNQVASRATTDSGGRYLFSDLAPTNYMVLPIGPTLAVPATPSFFSTPGKRVSIDTDEEIKGIDFSLSRGGVVTGRVTRSNGQPAIAMSVAVRSADNNGFPFDLPAGHSLDSIETDDRGIYRMFGLCPGRYRVCAEPDDQSRYPADSLCYSTGGSSGGTIDIAASQEVSNVDIALGGPCAGYDATGRVVDDNGQPLVGTDVSYFRVEDRDLNGIGNFQINGSSTDRNGVFKISGLVPGEYRIQFDPNSGYYGSAAKFQVSDASVSGIELKVHTGTTVSGIVSVDGNQDPQVLAQVPEIALVLSSQGEFFSQQTVHPGPDGTFQVAGIAPGMLNVLLDQAANQAGFSLLRIEQAGVAQPGGIQISAGEPVTGIVIVLGYGTATLRGQVVIQGGVLPNGVPVIVGALPISGGTPARGRYVSADARGRFEIDGLLDGQYQMVVGLQGDQGWRRTNAQMVTINGGQAPEITVVLNIAALPN